MFGKAKEKIKQVIDDNDLDLLGLDAESWEKARADKKATKDTKKK